MCQEGFTQGHKLVDEVQGDLCHVRSMKHDKADVGSPLLEAAPV